METSLQALRVEIWSRSALEDGYFTYHGSTSKSDNWAQVKIKNKQLKSILIYKDKYKILYERNTSTCRFKRKFLDKNCEYITTVS